MVHLTPWQPLRTTYRSTPPLKVARYSHTTAAKGTNHLPRASFLVILLLVPGRVAVATCVAGRLPSGSAGGRVTCDRRII
ncbi:hypothetical protein PAXRUDRAFT_763076 [Paxillus rubicundulus Ve08.2h10]|uniref:Uncharacterized protein n=1 Tax=Paxillus rubicundulus Ve08.2h10 TaxID=930991 RepID=A0A0D0DAZ3_9AGAM|nr:hypothetical protein PAXRUDRAFT_763076 [Paxillus rubicundulus Ve08.2h10]